MTDWGGRYPPGAANDPAAPYNQPDVTDLLPLVCEADTEEGPCGFRAETLDEMADHEHGEEHFVQPHHEDPFCMVCNPPPWRKVQHLPDTQLPFCGSHDLADYRAKKAAAPDPDADDVADRYREG